MKKKQKNTSSLPRFWIIAIGIILFCLLGMTMKLGYDAWNRDIVVSVVDGDSVDVADGRRIRLLGLDAPERGRCGYEEAKKRLTELTVGRHVRLKHTVKDSYGRLLAEVITDPTFSEWMTYIYHRFIKKDDYQSLAFLNWVIIREGLGKYTNAGTENSKLLNDAGQIARTRQLGIYSPTCLQLSSPEPNCFIKGNIRNGKKMYHVPSCFNYDQTIMDTAFGDQWFCTEREAESAGFIKAGSCL